MAAELEIKITADGKAVVVAAKQAENALQGIDSQAGKTGTAPTGQGDTASVWFTGWLEPGSLPGQAHRLAVAARGFPAACR